MKAGPILVTVSLNASIGVHTNKKLPDFDS